MLSLTVGRTGFGSGDYAVDVQTATPGAVTASFTASDGISSPSTSQQSVSVSVAGTATADDSGVQLSLS